MKTRLSLTALAGAALLWAAGASALRAQDAQPGAAPADGGVNLVYKYKPGQVQRYKANMTMDLTLTPEGGAAGLGPIPMSGKMDMAYTEKVTGTRQGTATLAWKLDNAAMSYNVLGTSVSMKRQNGKWVTLLNGQPAPAGANAGVGAGAANALPTGAVTMYRGPRGETSGPNGQSSVGQLVGGAMMSAALLPDHPVKVGDSWESTQKLAAAPVPGPAGSAAAAPPIEVKFTHTLKDLQNKNGRQFAIIESTGSGSTPEASGPASASQNISGTSRFDVARGALVSAQYNVDLSMKVPIQVPAGAPAGAAPGAAPQGQGAMPQGMSIDGTMKVTLMEAPAARAAPAKKPTRRKR